MEDKCRTCSTTLNRVTYQTLINMGYPPIETVKKLYEFYAPKENVRSCCQIEYQNKYKK